MVSTPRFFEGREVGYDIPAMPGMPEADIQTPALVIDLDALERNITRMQGFADEMGVRLRVHGKMHKSADIARMQIAAGACGICCQKVAEAEAFVRHGITDVLLSNQVRDPLKIDRLARLANMARIAVCVDDPDAVAELSYAAVRHGVMLDVLVEIDCGAGRCGVACGAAVVDIAQRVIAAPGLRFVGLQAYQGGAQHVRDYAERKALITEAVRQVSETTAALRAVGIACKTVSGAGTGSYEFEGRSGVYTELQCGSYAFMDADYRQVRDRQGEPVSAFEHALFILTSVMSRTKADKAIVDAGLKVQSVDSGLPVVFGRSGIVYAKATDEHGVVLDPDGTLRIGDKLKLIPGHIDPTCNLHDWYVGVRGGRVERLIPVTARGKAW